MPGPHLASYLRTHSNPPTDPAEKPGKATTAGGNQGANNKDERCQGAGELLFYEIANTIKLNSFTPPSLLSLAMSHRLSFRYARKIVVFPFARQIN